jgi:hypothetical protein
MFSCCQQLDTDLRGSVQKLLDLCKDDFWHRGRILVQVERQMVLIVDGQFLCCLLMYLHVFSFKFLCVKQLEQFRCNFKSDLL